MMSKGLLTEQDIKEFRDEYGSLIKQQCRQLLGNTKAAKELEERVVRSMQAKYEFRPLPKRCETILIAECCILSLQMEKPAAEDAVEEEPDLPEEETAPEQTEIKKPAAKPAVKPSADAKPAAKPAADAKPAAKPAADAKPPAAVKPAVPAPQPSAENLEKRAQEDLPEVFEDMHLTASYDPVKTALWLPNGLKPEEESRTPDPIDPTEDEPERNVLHSIINTLLVLLFMASIVFFLWKCGILYWIRIVMERVLTYG
ncbi:MAG: hypothetical protein IK099_09810 [Clostridia bacterium]|nr:hypothetical protein [Clostridia bacterium]